MWPSTTTAAEAAGVGRSAPTARSESPASRSTIPRASPSSVAAVSASAVWTAARTRCDGGTLYWARTWRTAVTTPWTVANVAAASASVSSAGGVGQRLAMHAWPGSRGRSVHHSSSVTNGMNGCRSPRICSNTSVDNASVSRDGASPWGAFDTSRYQSQKSRQTKS